MVRSTLKLTVEKGPREGETLDCTTRSVIKIGRVVKGNTFPIKDSGISSKHLLIEFKNRKWVISDLDSSNGTILNGDKIQPLMDFDLRDEDVIKIGERTSLKVKIVEETVDVEEEVKIIGETRPTKGTRKPSKKELVDVAVTEKIDAEHVEEQQVRRNPMRRAAPRNTRASSKDEKTESDLVSLSRPEKISEEQGRENVASVVADTRPRRGRPRKAKDEPAMVQKVPESSELAPESCEEPEIVVPVEEKRTRRGAPRKVQGSKDEMVTISEVQKISENTNADQEDVINVSNGDPFVEKQEERTKTSKEDEPQNLAPIEKKPTRRLAQKRRKTSKDDEPSKSARIPVIEVSNNSHNQEDLQQKTYKEPGSTSAVKENLVPTNDEKVGKEIDWEKMTLGEWFDYMEIYLPKLINERTDEIISSMRERSKQFNEFILQQKQQ